MTELSLTITETKDDGTEVATESIAYVVNTPEELATLLNAATAPKAKRPETLCAAQEEFIDTINAGFARWQHRSKPGQSFMLMGHYGRIFGGAKKKLTKQIRRMGFTEAQIPAIIQDALDIATLRRLADEDE